MKRIAVGFSLIGILIGVGCGGMNQFTTITISDAKAQVDAAKKADAQTLASQELADAEQMLARAELALDEGDKEVHRLSTYAYLKARVAEAVALANGAEAEYLQAEAELQLKVQMVEAARRQFEAAERELKQLKLTPEN